MGISGAKKLGVLLAGGLAIWLCLGLFGTTEREAEQERRVHAPEASVMASPRRAHRSRSAIPARLLREGDGVDERIVAIRDWTLSDPDAAFEWSLLQLKDGHFDYQQTSFLLAIADHWPERLAEFLDRIADWQYEGEYPENEAMAGLRTRFAVGNLARLLIEQRVENGALADWINALPPKSKVRPRLRSALARQWAATVDPAEAMAWLCRDGEKAASSTVDFVLDHWTRSEPEQAAAWVDAEIEQGRQSAERMGVAIFRWGQMDTDAAAAWMAEQVEAEPAWLDVALSSYVTVIAGDAPGDAIEWIGYIESHEQRQQVLQRMVKWTWDNKEAWDEAALRHISSLAQHRTAASELEEWTATLHSQAALAEARKHIK